MSKKEKEELLELANSTIIMYLGDKVSRDVKTASGVWLNLKQLCLTKTLTNGGCI